MARNITKLLGWGAGAVLLASTLYNAPRKTYEINGEEVKNGILRSNMIIEYKDDGKVKYMGRFLNHGRLKYVVIDGHKYNSHNNKIYDKAKENYNCLRGCILSAKEQARAERIAERKRERQRKIEERKEQERKDLDVLVRNPCQR